jgi:hypothetical protein
MKTDEYLFFSLSLGSYTKYSNVNVIFTTAHLALT